MVASSRRLALALALCGPLVLAAWAPALRPGAAPAQAGLPHRSCRSPAVVVATEPGGELVTDVEVFSDGELVAPMVSAARPERPDVEVLPPLDGDRPKLSDAAIGRILELVWRDTRKVASEYRVGDLSKTAAVALQGDRAPVTPTPFVWELVRERLPMLRWYAGFKLDNALLKAHQSEWALNVSPRGAADRRREACRVERRLDARCDRRHGGLECAQQTVEARIAAERGGLFIAGELGRGRREQAGIVACDARRVRRPHG